MRPALYLHQQYFLPPAVTIRALWVLDAGTAGCCHGSAAAGGLCCTPAATRPPRSQLPAHLPRVCPRAAPLPHKVAHGRELLHPGVTAVQDVHVARLRHCDAAGRIKLAGGGGGRGVGVLVCRGVGVAPVLDVAAAAGGGGWGMACGGRSACGACMGSDGRGRALVRSVHGMPAPAFRKVVRCTKHN